jgi:glycosyltransferase involved in cell wall biosynthesis
VRIVPEGDLLKICMVTTFYPPYNFGGDGVFIQQLSRDLVASGHEVHVVHSVDAFLSKGGRLSGEVSHDRLDGVEVHPLRGRMSAFSALFTQQTGRPFHAGRLRRLLASGFDVINYHNVSLVGGPAVFELGQGKKLFTPHEHWWVCPTHVLWKYTGELCTRPQCFRCCVAQGTPPQLWRRAKGWMARCLRHVDLILAPSKFTAARYRVWMDENGVETPIEILTGYTSRLKVTEDSPPRLPERFFLYVGRLTPAKGILKLLDAFARRPDYTLVVVGEGESESAIRTRGLENVHLAGRVARAELGNFYARAVALVTPSLCAETFGLAASEALSCGTPVVTSPSGGTDELVTEEVGYVYRTEARLLEVLDLLWNDRDTHKRLAERARKHYEAYYTPERYLRGYFAAIERVLAG